MPNHGIQRPRWFDVVMLLVRGALFAMISKMILDGEWRLLALAAFIIAYITFDEVKAWIERLAGVRP